MAKSTIKSAELIRRSDSVFVSVQPPTPVQQIHQPERFYQDWAVVAKQIVSSTPTDEPTPKADISEVRIYSEDLLSGKRALLYTGQPQADTADLCQAYANLTGKRIERHDAVDSTVYHPETSPIPTLNDWVEVYNADDGSLIWVGLQHDGFYTRCKVYADRKGVGLRVDSAHENRSQFFTPKAELARYARENAKHFARKHGLAIADAAGVIAITVVSWAAYVIGGAV